VWKARFRGEKTLDFAGDLWCNVTMQVTTEMRQEIPEIALLTHSSVSGNAHT